MVTRSNSAPQFVWTFAGLSQIKQGDKVVSNHTRVKVVKNKIAPPFREAEFDIMYNFKGISRSGDIIDLATNRNIIEKAGAWFSYNGEKIGQGREAAKTFFDENPKSWKPLLRKSAKPPPRMISIGKVLDEHYGDQAAGQTKKGRYSILLIASMRFL